MAVQKPWAQLGDHDVPLGPLFRLWRVNYGAGMGKGSRRLEAAQLRREMADKRFEDALESRLIGNESVWSSAEHLAAPIRRDIDELDSNLCQNLEGDCKQSTR